MAYYLEGEKMNHYPPVLILDLSATGIAVARILGNHGVDVYGADLGKISIGRFSKYVKKPAFGYKIEIDSHFLDMLTYFAKNFNNKPVLLPCSDIFIEFVSKYYGILKDFFSIQESLAPSISTKFLDKREFYKMCEEYNIPYPKTIRLSGYETVSEIVKKLKFPMILKPYLIHKWKKYLKGKKVILIQYVDELEYILKKEKKLLQDSLLQEVIPSSEKNIYIFKGYFGKDGELRASFTGRKIRQYPPNFGSFSLAESIENEEVKQMSINFLRKARFKGLCGTEFKYDQRDGSYKIIEINIRPQLWEDLTRLAEAEVLWAAYCDLAGVNLASQNKQKNNIKFAYLLRDLYSALCQIKNGDLRFIEWLKSYSNLKGDALIDLKDLKLLIGIPIYIISQFYLYKIKPFLS